MKNCFLSEITSAGTALMQVFSCSKFRIFHWFYQCCCKKPFLSDRWQYIFLNLLAFFKGNLWLNFRWIQGYYCYPISGPVPKLPIVQSPNVYWMKKTALWDQGGNCTANNFHDGVFHLPLLVHQGVINFCESGFFMLILDYVQL